MVTLDANRLVATARERAGASDLDDDTLPIRLANLAEQLDLRLDDHGRERAEAVILGLLDVRLRVLADRRAFPIGEERIERPIIAFGEARSGTTLLQMLLGCDPSSRLVEFWEVMRPSPPPGTSDTEARRQAGDDDWRELLNQIPQWLVSHPYNGMLGRNPPECERLWAFDFRSLPPSAWWRVPVVQWPPFRLPRDDARQYELHRMMLQHLQFGRSPRRWVLKGTSHQQRLPALLDAYPDAVFVWIHRDPLQAIASRIELMAQVYEGIGGPMDRLGFARATVASSVARFSAAVTSTGASDERIQHVVYQDFTADPVGCIRALYERAGIDFPPTFEPAMKTWMVENPSNRYGRFSYSVEALGVDVDALDRQLEPYRERFGVPAERKKG